MVKRSRVNCSSGGNNRRGSVVVTVCALVLYIVLFCCAGAGGAVVSGSSLGDRSQLLYVAAAERPSAAGTGRNADDAAAARNGRSTANLSHIMGTARKIKMFVKNRYLQVFPDGTVNSTTEDTSDYVILQRASVNMGQLKIQGVATCMYLCMDACGLLYGSKDFEEECVFNEMIEQHHYNTYSSAKYTNDKRTLYLALNKHGLPRKVQVKANASLGKLSTYTQVLTQQVSPERVERLLAAKRLAAAGDLSTATSTPHAHRHHHVCPPHTGPPLPTPKHRKSGKKCQTKGGGVSGGRKKAKDRQPETSARDGGGNKTGGEDDDCGGGGGAGNKRNNRCGGDEVSHRKADAAGRKKKSKKPVSGATEKGKGDKPHHRQGKSKKAESAVDVPQPPMPEPVVVVQTAVTTVVAPSQLLTDENDDGAGDDDFDNDDGVPAATGPTTDEFL